MKILKILVVSMLWAGAWITVTDLWTGTLDLTDRIFFTSGAGVTLALASLFILFGEKR